MRVVFRSKNMKDIAIYDSEHLYNQTLPEYVYEEQKRFIPGGGFWFVLLLTATVGWLGVAIGGKSTGMLLAGIVIGISAIISLPVFLFFLAGFRPNFYYRTGRAFCPFKAYGRFPFGGLSYLVWKKKDKFI